MGGAIGLLLGGALTEALDWRWCLYVSILFAVPAAIAGSRLLHHTAVRSRPRLDLPGTLTASSGLFALVYGLSRGAVRRLGRSRHRRLPDRQRRAARRVRRARAARRAPAAAAARGRRSRPRRLVPRHRDRQRRDLRRPAVPDLLPPEHEGLDRARDRPRVPADELLDRAHRRAHEHAVAAPHRPAAAGARPAC